MVSQTPDVQVNATLPAQDSSSSINTTARAEMAANPLNRAGAYNSNTSRTALVSISNHMGKHHANSFRMSANDVPKQLVLRGTSDEDVPATLAQFRKRVELKGDLHVPPPEIDNRAVRFHPLLLKSVALETYSQLTLGTLEWRSENTLSNLKLHRMDVTPVAPRSWSDWVEALTAMFAPPNLLENLCQEIAILRQSDKQHPGENIDQYALRISSLFTRLLTETARTTPLGKSPQIFAWERLKIDVFEKGLLPAIRVEQIREDPAPSFASARDKSSITRIKQLTWGQWYELVLSCVYSSCSENSVGDTTRQRAGNHCLTDRSANTAQEAEPWSLQIRAPGDPGATRQ